MSVKYYNPQTNQWETLASNQAGGVKLLDSEGVTVQTDDEGNEFRPTNVEDGSRIWRYHGSLVS